MDHKRELNDRSKDQQLSNTIIKSSCDENIPNIYKELMNENLKFERKINRKSNHLRIEQIQREELLNQRSPMLEDIQQMNDDVVKRNDVKQRNKLNFQLNRLNRWINFLRNEKEKKEDQNVDFCLKKEFT